MNQYCNSLNIKLPPLSPDFNIFETTRHQISVDTKYVNPELTKLLSDLGIYVVYIDLFYRKPFHVGSIHCDETGGDITKINWVYGGKGSSMNWYKIKHDTNLKNKKVSTTEASTSYIRFESTEVDFCYRSSMLSGPYLIQAGLPHLVMNCVENRYALSFVIVDTNHQRISMSRAQELLKNNIIS